MTIGVFKKKLLWRIIFVLLVLSIVVEIGLRVLFGLCDAPLYVSHKAYEYIAVPNQEGKRFGNHYHYNSYSQRSNEPDSTKTIILGLGDSVIFGGVQSDQDSIATSLVTNKIEDLQILNISAGSWGPDNCAAYLKENGTFNAKGMFLVVSSHDAYDNMDFQPVVGMHPSYPKEQYLLALWELLDRYLWPRLKSYFVQQGDLDPDQKVLQTIHKNGLVFNPGFNELKSIADSLNIPLVIYLHAEKSELLNNNYNEQGNEIIQWANKNKVKIVKELDYSFVEYDYRDNIHINDNGQRKLAKIMEENIPSFE